MPVKKDPMSGKNYEGSVYGGEGKNGKGYQQQGTYEYMGVYKSAPNPKLTPEKGFTVQRDGKEESRTFDGLTPGYASPQRLAFEAKDLGDRHPDDLQHS